MEADFTIEMEPAASLIRIGLRGFFEPADVARFYDALAAVHRRRGGKPNRHLTLVDISGLMIQSQCSVAAFADVLGVPAYRSRRLALVVGRSLTRSQAMRIIATRDARCFATTAEAEAWLFADATDAQAA